MHEVQDRNETVVLVELFICLLLLLLLFILLRLPFQRSMLLSWHSTEFRSKSLITDPVEFLTTTSAIENCFVQLHVVDAVPLTGSCGWHQQMYHLQQQQ